MSSLFCLEVVIVLIFTVEVSSETVICPSEISEGMLESYIVNSSLSQCSVCPTHSWNCGLNGGRCVPDTWMRYCHFFDYNKCPDKKCGCCARCYGTCEDNGICRQCCNPGEVENTKSNCCRGAKLGCVCCIPRRRDEECVGDKCKKYEDCSAIYQSGDTVSGLRTIYPSDASNSAKYTVYCDQKTDGGGWTVIQRRQNGLVRENFFRNWTDYRLGFGNKEAEFWLGNDIISNLTLTPQQLRVDLEDYEGEHRWAKYDSFYVAGLDELYKLTVGGYTGDAGDSLKVQSGQSFSTYDEDNDVAGYNCASTFKGAWWYAKCHASNLNGLPLRGEHESYADGINWKTWHHYHYSLAKTTMMIKPAEI